jgi:lipopolysaccharide heptosyltransferase I
MNSIELSTSPQRILLIKPSALGDIVHALPVLSLLRRRWPEAHIAWLVNRAFAELLDGHPQLDEVISFDRRGFARGWRDPFAAVGLQRFLRGLRRREFDLVIDLQGLFRSGWMTMSTRAPVRVGFADARELAHLFYTHRVPIGSAELHAVDRYLAVSDALGCGRGPVNFSLPVKEDDRMTVRAMLNGASEDYAVLVPGTNWPTKRWPAEHFAALVEPLRERLGLRAVVAGGKDVSAIAAQIPGALDLTGRTNLRELVALLDGAALVIANDSGPMHIAAALDRPLVTMFGPTNPVRTGPYGRMDSVVRLDIECSPCYSRRCSHTSCLKWLSVEMVLDVAEKQMRSLQVRGSVKLEDMKT